MRAVLIAMIMLSVLAGCENPPASDTPTADAQSALQPTSQKMTFDLAELDEQGLAGPPAGRVAVSYEFCIPDTEQCRRQVRSIDPSVEFYGDSKGRIGCSDDQCLCIGSTNQPEHRRVLMQLAELPYVERIDRCFFE